MVQALSGALSQLTSTRAVRVTYFPRSEAAQVQILTGFISEGWQTITHHLPIKQAELELLIADLNLTEEFVASNRWIKIEPFFVIKTNGTNLLTARILEKAFTKEGVIFRTEPKSDVSGLQTDTRFYPFTPRLNDWAWKLRLARRKK